MNKADVRNKADEISGVYSICIVQIATSNENIIISKPAYRWSHMMCSDVAKPIQVKKGGNCA